MFADNRIRPWWEKFEVTVSYDGGQLRTRCGVETLGPTQFLFTFLHAEPEIFELATQAAPVEVHFRGAKYRAYRYKVGEQQMLKGEVRIRGEQCGTVVSSAKPSIQDLLIEALRTEPGGMTARQIEDKLKCSRRGVFSALAVLSQSNRIVKDGPLYRVTAA